MKKRVKRLSCEFNDFIREYKLISAAVAFVMGLATNTLIKSFTNDILMPLLNPLLKSGNWEEAVWAVGPFIFNTGPFISATLQFVLIALIIFVVVKKLLKK